jgi:ribosomal protein S18 acetylase RimI-like enzyme
LEAVTTTIVPITPFHQAFEQVAALFNDYRAHYGRSASARSARDWLHDQLAGHTMTIAAAVQTDRVCGFITAITTPASLMLGNAWSIRDLYVAPQHRRCGIARRLLEHIIHEARAAGAQRLSLQTETDNVPALRLYAEAGFQPVTGLELLNLTIAPDNQDSQDRP